MNGETVKSHTTLLAGLAVTALVAGCGSSSNKSSSNSTPASNTSTPAAVNAYGTPTTTAAKTPATSGAAAVVSTKKDKLGTVLAGSKGLTLYLFEGDKGKTSACTGACAKAWPPLTTTGSPTAAKAAKSADLGTIKRSDGTTQVTYKGHPLYYFSADKDSGDAYGQGSKAFGAEWYVLAPSGNKIDAS